MPFEYVTVRQLRESTSFAREPEPICGIFRFPDETPVVMYWERVSVSGGALADDLRRMDKMQNLTVYAVSPSQLQSRKFDLTVPLKFGSLGATIWQQLGGGGSACPVAIPKRVPKTSSFRIAGKDVRRDGTRKPLTWVAREDFLQLAIHPSDHTPATTEAMLAIEQAPKDTCLILFWGA